MGTGAKKNVPRRFQEGFTKVLGRFLECYEKVMAIGHRATKNVNREGTVAAGGVL